MIATAGSQRAATAALDSARPALERLDEAADPEDLAASLLEAYEGVERALRALCGTPKLSGQQLIREARQREILTLAQAHAEVEFVAACERARETSYHPTAADVQSARVGFQQMEAVLTQTTVYSAPVETPTRNEAQSAASPAAVRLDDEVSSARPVNLLGRVLVGLLVVVVLAAGAYVVWQEYFSAQAAIRAGIAAYQAGRRPEAARQFDLAVERDPSLALPHVYAGRMYREDGNFESAAIELKRAIELEPQNALALREMGSYLLARGDYDLARAFYVRAISIDGTDRLAMGYLACALAKLGRWDEAQRFLARAGSGAWSACATPGAPAPLPR